MCNDLIKYSVSVCTDMQETFFFFTCILKIKKKRNFLLKRGSATKTYFSLLYFSKSKVLVLVPLGREQLDYTFRWKAPWSAGET